MVTTRLGNAPLFPRSVAARKGLWAVVWFLLLVALPLLLAFTLLHLWHWDFTVPIGYQGGDALWELIISKTLLDTGWVLKTPFLGAPDTAHWYLNSEPQTSAIHYVLMRALSVFSHDPAWVQQVYYLLNFPIITATTYLTCRVFKIDPLAALGVALLFAFTNFRVHNFFGVFIQNYFAVPLSLIPVLWIMAGRFSISRQIQPDAPGWSAALRAIILSRPFAFGLVACVLVGASGGYYAFFCLLCLAFAAFFRAICGDARSPLSFVAPMVYIAAVIGTVISLSVPLSAYHNAHPEEADQDAIKFPAEAEVYSAGLNYLVAPTLDHRVKPLRELGRMIVDAGNFNRKFPMPGGAPVPLSTIPTLLLVAALALLCIPPDRWPAKLAEPLGSRCVPAGDAIPFLWTVCALALFVLLCSVSGGIGTIIALAYPTIRAYARFTVFLIFLLYLGAGFAVTLGLNALSRPKRVALSAFIGLVTVLGILDQVPEDPYGLRSKAARTAHAAPFLADRDFVQKLESSLPIGAMIYQYPYSQFLTDSKYYGWASYAQSRFYIHSDTLRWSNGATKGSGIDRWHSAISALPIEQLLTEVRAVGFAGILVDQTVVPPEEYAAVRRAVQALAGAPPLESAPARLDFWKLPSSGYRLEYDEQYKEAKRLVVLDRTAVDLRTVPRLVNKTVLANLIAAPGGSETVFDRSAYPDLFLSSESTGK